MIETILLFALPLGIAFMMLGDRVEKAWAFFCSSLISFYLTFHLLSLTLPLFRQLLGAGGSAFLFLLAFTAVGILLTVILYILLSLVLYGGFRAEFPEKIAKGFRFVLIYAGVLMQLVLLTIGILSIPFLHQHLPKVAAGAMKASSPVVQKALSLCGTRLTSQQKNWIIYAPLHSVTPEKTQNEEPAPAGKNEPAKSGLSKILPDRRQID